MAKTFGVIIPAAGSGKRFGGDKLSLNLLGHPVLWHTLQAFEQAKTVSYIVISTRKESLCFVRELCREFSKVIAVVEGGNTRQESVKNGLDALPEVDFVSIHDGARPLILPDEIDRLHRNAVKYGAICAGTPVVDTIQQVDKDGVIVATPDRDSLIAAATPQVFERISYRDAYDRATETHTDDAGLYRAAGGRVKMILCQGDNFKITTKEDAFRAQQILLRRAEKEMTGD
ncbi:MAG: 2-C-methyl-D-erythritol 4-phosphate cytidylyltransferase [Clostridia bacterium]|nr:2-C-methyl-D-erythritol 4-phosphate cytidylyltransferase [Clostridia bacterium]